MKTLEKKEKKQLKGGFSPIIRDDTIGIFEKKPLPTPCINFYAGNDDDELQ